MREISELELKAKEFAVRKHGDQQYSTGPYSNHLEAVVNVLVDEGYDDPFWLAAGWTHDTLEDTDTTMEEFVAEFGPDLHKVVWACSGFGVNRKARNADIYAKLANFPSGCIVKVADRIANVEASVNNPSKASMYVKEHESFTALVYNQVPSHLFERYVRAVDAVR